MFFSSLKQACVKVPVFKSKVPVSKNSEKYLCQPATIFDKVPVKSKMCPGQFLIFRSCNTESAGVKSENFFLKDTPFPCLSAIPPNYSRLSHSWFFNFCAKILANHGQNMSPRFFALSGLYPVKPIWIHDLLKNSLYTFVVIKSLELEKYI